MCVWGWGMYFSDSPREKRKATRGGGILRRAFHPFPMPSAGSPLLKRPRDTWETPGISSFHSVLWALYYQKGTASEWILQQTNGNIDIIITCTVVPTGPEKCYTQLVLCLPVSKSPNPSESLAYDLSPVKPLCYRMREKQITHSWRISTVFCTEKQQKLVKLRRQEVKWTVKHWVLQSCDLPSWIRPWAKVSAPSFAFSVMWQPWPREPRNDGSTQGARPCLALFCKVSLWNLWGISELI